MHNCVLIINSFYIFYSYEIKKCFKTHTHFFNLGGGVYRYWRLKLVGGGGVLVPGHRTPLIFDFMSVLKYSKLKMMDKNQNLI